MTGKEMTMLALVLLQAAGAPLPPPMTAMPAPISDPWPTQSQACTYVQEESRSIARHKPAAGADIVDVEQAVDCDARIVTRVFVVESKWVRLAESAQRTADKLACLNPRNQIMYERDGWSFRAEFRGPKGRAAMAAASAKCPPLNLGGYQSPR
jgi:hypothetical protein